jgi:hypothetical protein
MPIGRWLTSTASGALDVLRSRDESAPAPMLDDLLTD